MWRPAIRGTTGLGDGVDVTPLQCILCWNSPGSKDRPSTLLKTYSLSSPNSLAAGSNMIFVHYTPTHPPDMQGRPVLPRSKANLNKNILHKTGSCVCHELSRKVTFAFNFRTPFGNTERIMDLLTLQGCFKDHSKITYVKHLEG